MRCQSGEKSGAILISIEGNIGAGKSTLMESLRGWHPGCPCVPEPIGEWTKPLVGREGEVLGDSALGRFYSSPERHAMEFQVMVASSKARGVAAALRSPGGVPGGAVFCERDPFDTEVFPRANQEEGLFDESHVRVLGHLMDTLRGLVGTPGVAGSIYLRADPEQCAERIRRRGRGEEAEGRGLDGARLRVLHALHERRFNRQGSPDVLVLDAGAPVESHRGAVAEFVTSLAARVRREP